MKKLVGVLVVVLTLTISLVGCTSTPQDIKNLSKSEVLEIVDEYCEIDYLTQDIYCDSTGVTDASVLQVINAFEDVTVYPSYMLDENDEYVTVDQIGLLLKAKYFINEDVNAEDDYYKKDGKTLFKFDLGVDDLASNDLFAKAVLILNEIENYDYYYLSSTDVVIDIVWMDTNYYAHRVTLTTSKDNLLSDTLIITPEGFFTNYLEMEYDTMDCTVTQPEVLAYYYAYTTNETYGGYVLNYEE